MAFLSPEDEKTLAARVAEIEACSSAELVIAIRPQSASYPQTSMAVGGLGGLVALIVLVYGPWPVDWHFLILDPLLAGLVLGFAASRVVGLKRLLAGRGARRSNVERAAKAEFLDRGVHNTRDRTGILLYISMLERSASLVADSGLSLALPKGEWQTICDGIRDLVESGAEAAQIAEALVPMAALLALHLPRRADDINELSDAIEVAR